MTQAPKKKMWKKVIGGILLVPLVLFVVVSIVVVVKKDAIVQSLIETLNEDFKGTIVIRDNRIAPFENFPYISIDLKGFQLFEGKDLKAQPVISLEDVYVGFDLWTVLKGKYDIKTIKLKNGLIDIIQSEEGVLNILTAFETTKEIEDVEEEFHLNLKSIVLQQVELAKTNLADSIKLDALIDKAELSFKKSPTHIEMELKSTFVLNILKDKDSTFVKNKHFKIATDFDFDKKEHLITFAPSEVTLENGVFGMEGSADFDDDFNVNLKFNGKKPNFDLLIAFAPNELVELLGQYDNRGEIYFDAVIKGKTINGHQPSVEAKFGCKEGYFDNTATSKKLDEMFFNAYFTNGEQRNLESSRFELKDFSARPEAGKFIGNLVVENFISPDINLQLDSDFDLEFLTKFFNLNDFKNLTGKVLLKMNFHDIIDLTQPEKSLEKFNQAYYSELQVTNLNFKSDSYHLPIRQLNIKALMDGNDVKLEQFEGKVGTSDISMKGRVFNIPALLHRTNAETGLELSVSSKLLNFKELTSGDTLRKKPFNEKIRNLSVGFSYKGPAYSLFKEKGFPEGNFKILDFYGKLEHYPHTFHDFDALLVLKPDEIELDHFDGMIDDSDFHIKGSMKPISKWLEEHPKGMTHLEFDVKSNLLRLKDIFAYKGENYIPEDYREEEITQLATHGRAFLHFDDGLKATDLELDFLKGKMKIHPLKFEDFKGRLHFEDERLTFKDFRGRLGRSDFSITGNYYFGSDVSKKEKGDELAVISQFLDFDTLFPHQEVIKEDGVTIDHDAGFNLFEVPFPKMKISTQIGELHYHKYKIKNFNTEVRIQPNHKIFVDKMSLLAAGGKVNMTGYFNGSDPKHIYLFPDLKIEKVNLDEVLFKFDNFGQDQLISENLHGLFTGRITGKILLHTDLTPIIDASEITVDVSVVNGKLERFGPVEALSDFFRDKNLSKVLFDKLENRITLKNGTMEFPNMIINSSLGFIQLSGKQDADLNMEYYIRVPLKLVTQAASQKLFGRKKEDIDPDREDEIIVKDPNRKISYINLKISGTPSNYKITLQKNKDLKKGNQFVKDESFLFESEHDSTTQGINSVPELQ
jgi:hypothetical protein